MSQNLANAQTRVSRQDRLTDRRAQMLPEIDRRATALELSGTMRTAARGDSGAEALMQTLGIVSNAAKNFQAYADEKFAQDETAHGAQGAADEAAGTVDPEAERRSVAYRNAVALGRTSTAWNEARRSFASDLTGVVESQDDESLEVRKRQVADQIDGFYRAFALDPATGQPKAFLSTPEAKRWLANEMAGNRRLMTDAAMGRIEERFNAESVGHFQQGIIDQVDDLKTPDLSTLLKMLPPSVSKDAARKALVQTYTMLIDKLGKSDRPQDQEMSRRLADQIIGDVSNPTAPGISIIDPNEGLTATPTAPAGASGAAKPPSSGRVSFEALKAAVMGRESGGNAAAVSPKGARGTMQTMPFTLTDPGYGVKPAANNSPAELERVGTDYLRAMLRNYGGSVPLALAAYNAGPGVVDDWLAGTNRTGKNPSLTKLADPRKGGTAVFMAAIPFRETRDYVAAISSHVGLTSGGPASGANDPVTPDPNFSLDPETLDPIERAKRTPGPSLVPLLTGEMALKPEELTSFIELRDSLSRNIRADFDRKTREDQDSVAGGFLLRLNGQGPTVTSGEIADAARRRLIRPDQVASLFGVLRANQNDLDNAEDRRIARLDRDTARDQEKSADAIIGHYTASVLDGRESAQAARARLLQDVQHITDPVVRRKVIAGVNSLTGEYETLRNNSQPVRDAMGRLDEVEAKVADSVARVPSSRRLFVGSKMRTELDLSKSRAARRIQSGEDPTKVVNEEETRLGTVFGTITRPPPPRSN